MCLSVCLRVMFLLPRYHTSISWPNKVISVQYYYFIQLNFYNFLMIHYPHLIHSQPCTILVSLLLNLEFTRITFVVNLVCDYLTHNIDQSQWIQSMGYYANIVNSNAYLVTLLGFRDAMSQSWITQRRDLLSFVNIFLYIIL